MMVKGIHYSREYERELLGIMMKDSNVYDLTANLVDTETFYHPDTRTVYEAIGHMINQGYPVNIINMTDYLRRQKVTLLNGDEMVYYISTLTNSMTNAAHMNHAARRLREMQAKREMLKLAGIGADAEADPFDQHCAYSS